MGRSFRQPPPRWLGWLLALGLVVLWGFIRLGIFAGQAFPLAFVIPLLLGVWTLSRRMVWAMAVAFLAVATLEFALLMPGFSQGTRLGMWVATAFSILVGATVVHLIILLRLDILASLTRLEEAHEQITAQHEALEAQADELAQQNEELARQQETLTHQAERLAQQAEELEIQNEALQVQAEETQSLNAELDQRERLLQMLLDATRLQAGEKSVLQDIAAAAADILGEPRGLVVVCEHLEEGFAVRAAVDEDGAPVALADAVCPAAMSELALQERRPAALADASLRPDLAPAPPAGRPPVQALLTAPYVGGAANPGTISALSFAKREWTAEQFRLMEWLAGQAGRTLESLRLQAALRESEERFRLIADELPLMIWVVDAAGQLTFVNRTYCELLGTTLAEARGDGWHERLHPDDAGRYLATFRRALDERAPFRRRIRVRSARDEWRWIDSVGVPRFAGDGTFLGMLGSSPDITDIVLAEQVLRDAKESAEVLASVDALIHSSLQLEEVIDEVLARSARALDCQVMHVLRRSARGEWQTYRAYREAAEMPADLAGREQALAEAAWRAARERVAAGPQPELAPLMESSAELASLAVPLVARESFLGLIACHRLRDPESFDAGRIDFARRLAASLSLAMENARLYEEQRQIAVTLQENFMHPLPRVPSVDLAVVAQAAGSAELIGGDFHDAFRLPGGRVAVLIGDVSGKGVRASGLGETVRSAVRALSLVTPSAPLVLSHVDRLLLTEEVESFVSLLLLLIDTQTGMVEISSAGHPPPICLRAGAAEPIALEPGPPLGTFPWQYEATRLRLVPGDVLVAYTDGLTEARAVGRLFGEQRVVDLVREIGGDDLNGLVEGLRAAAVQYAGTAQDDLQVLGVRYLGPSQRREKAAEPVLRLTVPPVVAGLGDVRAAVRELLADCAVDERATARVVLCVEEACANAIRHSHSTTPASLEVRVGDAAVAVCVADKGKGMDLERVDLERPPELSSEGRRGLYLIRQYSDTMELSSDGGMVVRFTVRREQQAPA